ncbi:outer membrane beta-barrel protein [Shewanella sp. 202IG2-18]|uniref:outer membrane protein n=1 Tax=Parashewanella hymeniacidonis TaxID=2807618 RepID=UPI0019611DD1|nr:outer membrane beta-barrel protein [Parashewanella hymeniacidonis]MBM7072316.1 outer membrane beta-barrel protein [Parashewanella hymeniacidonis]
MMLKKVIFATLIASVSGSCLANWVGDVSYLSLSDSNRVINVHSHKNDVTLGVLALSAGYEIPLAENFSITPEAQYGFGIKDDTLNIDDNGATDNVTVDVDKYYGFNLRAQYNFTPQFYAYVQPQYTKIKVEAKHKSSGAKDYGSETKFGYGGGVGYQITPQLGANLGFVRFNSLDVDGWQLGMRYKF